MATKAAEVLAAINAAKSERFHDSSQHRKSFCLSLYTEGDFLIFALNVSWVKKLIKFLRACQ